MSTPTGAAEKSTPDRKEIEQELDSYLEEMKSGLKDKLEDMSESIKDIKEDLNDALINKINQYKLILNGKKEQLIALNPEGILERGYSITLNKDGKVITSKNDVKTNDEMLTILRDGKIKSKVEEE